MHVQHKTLLDIFLTLYYLC